MSSKTAEAAVNATNLTNPVVTLEAEVANPWRAGCLETCTSGSEGGVRKHSSAVRLAPTLQRGLTYGREIFPLSQDLARWDSNRVRKDGRDWSPNCTSPKDAKGHLNDPLVGWDSAKSGWGHRVTAPYVIPLSLLL